MFTCVALRLNLKLGIPDLAAYMILGPIIGSIEKALTHMPSFIIMAKIIPPGVEATFMSLATTILSLNQHSIRAVVGVMINDATVNVTK